MRRGVTIPETWLSGCRTRRDGETKSVSLRPLGVVKPLVSSPESVESARIGGIGVVDDAVLEHERAHARPLARIRGHIGSGHGRELLRTWPLTPA